MTEKRLRNVLCWFIPTVLVFSLYFQVRTHEYISYDDRGYTYENPMVIKGLTWEGVRWAFEDSHFANYHPLTWISHMVDFSLFGNAPGYFALENALIHGLNSLLLALILVQVLNNKTLGIIGATIFAAHPVLIESVAWISQRKTVLASFWFLGCLYLYLLSRKPSNQEKPKKRSILLTASVACFYTSLLCKSMFVTLPALLILIELMIAKDGQGIKAPISFTLLRKELLPLLFKLLPYLLGSLIFSMLAVWSQTQGGAIAKLESYPLPDRLLNLNMALFAYLSKFIFPIHLSLYYPLTPKLGLMEPLFRGSILLAITVLLYTSRKKIGTMPLAAWVFFLVSILPVIGIVQVGPQSYADRYMYGPIIGLIILVLAIAHRLIKTQKPLYKNLASIGIGACLALMAITSFFQIGSWKDDYSISQSILDWDPDNPVAADILLSSLIKYGNYEKAEAILRQQIQIYPNNTTYYGKLALCLALTGKHHEALAFQKKFISMSPRPGAGLVNLIRFYSAVGEREKARVVLNDIRNSDYELHQSEIKILAQLEKELTEGLR